MADRQELTKLLEESWMHTQRMVLGVSAGSDSMALLHCVVPWAQSKGVYVVAAHVNHSLRPEATEEAEFVQQNCQALGIDCKIEKIDVQALAEQRKRGVEEAGRYARYRFFRHVMQEERCDVLVLAQHADDQAETMLLHLARGSGLDGLTGMRVYSDSIWRPFLSMRKEELRSFLAQNHLTYREDESNASPEYARNRVRILLRDWENIHPGASNNMLRTAAILQVDADYLQEESRKAFVALRNETGYDRKGLCALPEALRRRAIRTICQESGLSIDVHERTILAMEDILPSTQEKYVDLPQNLIAIASGNNFRLEKKSARRQALSVNGQQRYGFALGTQDTPFAKIYVTEEEKPKRLGQDWPWAIEANPDALEQAQWRGWRQGDWICPLGMMGKRKKMQDVFTDAKWKQEQKGQILLLCQEGEVLYAPGLVMSDRLNAAELRWVWRIEYMKKDFLR